MLQRRILHLVIAVQDAGKKLRPMMFSLQQQNSCLATVFLFIITINDEEYVTQTIDSYFLLYTYQSSSVRIGAYVLYVCSQNMIAVGILSVH